MKRLNRPDLEPKSVYETCIQDIGDPGLAARFELSEPEFVALAIEYDNYATANQLYKFVPSEYAKPQQLVFAELTKCELMDLYSTHMVGDKTAGRAYYDKLITLPPNGKCPYCWFGQVSTLDHFLAKSRYPAFAVLPANLVPSCGDCNKGKGSSALVEAKQIPHPYFAEPAIETDAWLFAEIVATRPAKVEFTVKVPEGWPPDLGLRVRNYFDDLDLAKRFAIEAASEIVSVGDMLKELTLPETRKAVVAATAKSERKQRTNCWRAALYEALASSTWFLDGGFAAV